MPMMRRAVFGLLVLAMVGATGGCSQASAIVVGAVYPTGPSHGPGGLEEYRGLLLAAERANAGGGVGGRPVRIELERAESADAAAGAVDRLADDGVTVIAGSYGSTISRPAASAATRRGVVFWETGAVGELAMDAARGERVFRFPASGGVLGREAVAFVSDQLAPDVPLRFAIAYVDDPYGRAVADGAIAEARVRDGEPATFPYTLPDLDADAIAREVASSGANVLVVVAYLDDGVELRRAVVRQRVPLVANIGTSSSYCMPVFGDILGPDAVGVFASDKPDGDVIDADVLRDTGAELLRWGRDTYRDRYGEPMSAAALSGYAAGWALLGHVLPSAADLSPDSVAAAARSVRVVPGDLPNGSGLDLAGPDDLEPGSNLAASSVIWQWVAPQVREVVWPPTFATHDGVPPA